MISYKVNDYGITIKVLKMKDKYLDILANSEEIKYDLMESVIRNIKVGKSSDNKSYPKLTYKGFGKSARRRSDYKPLYPLIKYIKTGEILSEKTSNSVIYSFYINEYYKYMTLIHNTGKVTYNPYAPGKRSYVKKREFLYISKQDRKKIGRSARNLILFNRLLF